MLVVEKGWMIKEIKVYMEDLIYWVSEGMNCRLVEVIEWYTLWWLGHLERMGGN